MDILIQICFTIFLKERGATEQVLKGVQEYQCPTCVENQGAPLLARPGSIHRKLDFNEVGGDGAWWNDGERISTLCIL